MKAVHLVLAAFGVLLLQMFVTPIISIGPVAPDFPLLLVAFFALGRPPARSSVVGFFIGLVEDLFNPQFFGLNALTKSLVGYGAGTAASRAATDNIVFLTVILAVAAAAHDLVYLLFFTGADPGRLLRMWTTVSLPSAVYSALVGVALLKLSAYVKARVVKAFGKTRA